MNERDPSLGVESLMGRLGDHWAVTEAQAEEVAADESMVTKE